MEVTYKCPTVLKAKYPWYWFFRRLSGPIVSVVVSVQISSTLNGSNGSADDFDHAWAVELSSLTSTGNVVTP